VVIFPAVEHHCPLASTRLYCLVTEAHRCENLSKVVMQLLPRVGFEPTTYDLLTRFPRLLESPGFFCKFSRPWKVLENGFGPGNFGARVCQVNFLGYDVGGRQNDAGAQRSCVNLSHTSSSLLSLSSHPHPSPAPLIRFHDFGTI